MDNSQYLVSLKDRLIEDTRSEEQTFNLAFGNILRQPNSSLNRIIEQLSDVFHYTQTNSRDLIEQEFQECFWEVAKQNNVTRLSTTLFCYSASTAIEIVSNFLKRSQLRTALIEPTIDNLPAILRRVGVDIVCVDEEKVYPTPDFDLLSSLDIDAIFIVSPNNPTGRTFDKDAFNAIISFCSRYKKTLIVDFCFRFFVNSIGWDQYTMALDADCDFLFIEDTGKTWPLLDLKTGLLTTHPRIFNEVYRIYNEFLLNVSPFTLEVLRRYILISNRIGVIPTVTDIVQKNREYFRSQIVNTILRPANLDSQISFEWILIHNDYTDQQIWQLLKNVGIFVLPGSLFFWNTPLNGTKNLRVALMRDTIMFKSAIDILVSRLSTSHGI